jgi:AcrR family transcriptional regulator
MTAPHVSTPAMAKTRRKLPRDQRRQTLLEAGVDLAQQLFAERKLDPLASITPAAVIDCAQRRAAQLGDSVGVSKSMLYYLWGDGMEGYRRDLIAELVTRIADPDGLVDQISNHVDSSWTAVIREGANYEFTRLAEGGRDHDATLMSQVLAVTALDAGLRATVEEGVVDYLAGYVDLYVSLLDTFGRRVVPPMTVEQLASMFSAAAAGFAQESLFDPSLLNSVDIDADGNSWTPYALCVRAMIDAHTEPLDRSGE